MGMDTSVVIAGGRRGVRLIGNEENTVKVRF